MPEISIRFTSPCKKKGWKTISCGNETIYKISTRETIFRATVGTSLFVGPTNLDTIFTNPLTTLCPLLLKLVTCLLKKGFSRKQQRLFTVADFGNVTSVTFWTIYIDAADFTKISHQNITLHRAEIQHIVVFPMGFQAERKYWLFWM